MDHSIEDAMEAAYQVERLQHPLINLVAQQLGEDAAKMLYCLGWTKGHLAGLSRAKAMLDA